MGLLSWLFGEKEPAPPAVTFDRDAVPIGLDKPASECSTEEIIQANHDFWDANSDVIAGWKLDVALDHKSTLWEIANYGREAAKKSDLPTPPEGLGFRAAILPITKAAMSEKEERDQRVESAKVIAKTAEELEALTCNPRLYKKKTTKKETGGTCYFVAAIDLTGPHDQRPGEWLSITKATRDVVLGEELSADFESSVISGSMPAQQWVDQKLAYLR